MKLYELEQKLDIIISILNNNMEVIRMAMCPYCNNFVGLIDFNEIIFNERARNDLFSSAELVRCSNNACNKEFYKTNAGKTRVYKELSVDMPRRGSEWDGLMPSRPRRELGGKFNVSVDVSLTKDEFAKLKEKYFVGSEELSEYLNGELKKKYKNVLVNLKESDSNELKLIAIQLVIKEFIDRLNNKQTVLELIDSLPKTKYKVKDFLINLVDNKISSLEDVDVKRAHNFLDILLTKEYKYKKDLDLLEKDYQKKKQTINSNLDDLINNLK